MKKASRLMNIDNYYLYDSCKNNLLNILLENPKFYNDKKLIENDYPLLPYFTYTNFSILNDDFINQYIYYFYDTNKYPFISSVLSNENNIFTIIDFIPKLNQFSNKVYDKLNIRYNRKEIHNKKIKEVFKDELKKDINIFNNFIENNNKLFDKRNKINEDENLKEIINIPGSKINLIYTKIIQMYNTFLGKMKLGNYIKENIDNVIIQEAKENDYNFNYVLNNENKITIKEKMNQLILLYSKRERKENNVLNVYNGGKIIYNFEIIERKLEEHFILGKKYFKEKQKMFIYSEDIFEKEEDIFKKIKEKFEQKKIGEDNSRKIDEYLHYLTQEKILNIFYELVSLLNHLTQNEFDLKIKNDEDTLDDIINYLEIKSYKSPQLNTDKEFLEKILSVNTLLDFYEKVQNKSFNYLTNNIKQKIINDRIDIEENIQNEIESCLMSNKHITKNILISSVKKYILRHIKNKENFLFNFSDLIDKKDIWDESIYGDKDFLEDFNKLFHIEEKNGKNCVTIYCYLLIYEIKLLDRNNNDANDEDDGDELLD